ncbi:hypothetical protein D355_00294 [Enterococcus faecium SD1C-2]|nr:hypothetical protein D355_00294 [Enterococcus faecium SD1C-2]
MLLVSRQVVFYLFCFFIEKLFHPFVKHPYVPFHHAKRNNKRSYYRD